ncbi:MAG: DNA methyltransferase, partial [Myxococcota bacterium]|nr:DNA methyltransferase [Myxococcota bacterium]
MPPRRKRSFTNVGGPVDRGGDAVVARELARALDVRPAPEPDRWTHGFHAYPARMHPDTAARLVAAFSDPGEVVLDPFCGSGTVLVEAMVGGCRAVGRDLNPLAVRIARLRTTVIPAAARRALRERARAVAGRALERSRGGC